MSELFLLLIASALVSLVVTPVGGVIFFIGCVLGLGWAKKGE